jgi:DNA polymerase
MGPQKFRIQLKTFGVDLPLAECKRIISAYRETYPMIPRLWSQAQEALNEMVRGGAKPIGVPNILSVSPSGVRLPNGLWVKYPGLRLRVYEKTGKEEMVYTTKKGKASIPNRIYGGKMVENLCQALARIIIGEQMLMIARRLPVVMTVHDAVGALAKVEEADEGRTFVEQCMRIRPKWAQGLPLNCESKIGISYGG